MISSTRAGPWQGLKILLIRIRHRISAGTRDEAHFSKSKQMRCSFQQPKMPLMYCSVINICWIAEHSTRSISQPHQGDFKRRPLCYRDVERRSWKLLFTIHYSTCMQSMWCDKNKQTHGISSRSICLLANSGVNMAYSWTSESTDFTTLDNQDPVDQMPLQSPL